MDFTIIRDVAIVGLEIALTAFYSLDGPARLKEKFGKKGRDENMTITIMLEMLVTILGMVFFCFFTSGIDKGFAGSIFEKKSTPEQRAMKEAARQAEERGTVRGGRKQIL